LWTYALWVLAVFVAMTVATRLVDRVLARVFPEPPAPEEGR